MIFLSTLSLRRATLQILQGHFLFHISIHALLAESDFLPRSLIQIIKQISIHALLAESDKLANVRNRPTTKFLSTLSLRRATTSNPARAFLISYFYPRSPCGERLQTSKLCNLLINISIHALLAESDGIGLVFLWWGVRFLSTLSLRRATVKGKPAIAGYRNFYPRSPCGERLVHALELANTMLFLSTLSLRRATNANCSCHSARPDFYPRSPCGERRGRRVGLPVAGHFYPRSPCGERPPQTGSTYGDGRFLSTLSLRRATKLASCAIYL